VIYAAKAPVGDSYGCASLTDAPAAVENVGEDAIKQDYEKYSKWCRERGSRPMSFASFREHEIEYAALLARKEQS
jgi:hypothetical protein